MVDRIQGDQQPRRLRSELGLHRQLHRDRQPACVTVPNLAGAQPGRGPTWPELGRTRSPECSAPRPDRPRKGNLQGQRRHARGKGAVSGGRLHRAPADGHPVRRVRPRRRRAPASLSGTARCIARYASSAAPWAAELASHREAAARFERALGFAARAESRDARRAVRRARPGAGAARPVAGRRRRG